MPAVDWPGRIRRWWARLQDLGSRSGRGRPLRPPGDASTPVGSGWDAPADARAQRGKRFAAAGTRLHAEEARLEADRAYGEVDLGAHERHAGQDHAHRAALRRFRIGRPGSAQ
jgi:hypothetical protein